MNQEMFPMLEEIQQDAAKRMRKSVEALTQEMAKVRTGRAHPSLLAHITVSYYGAETPLNQMASVNVGDARTLVLNVFDKTMVQAVEKAIMTSDLGLTPNTAGTTIRVPMPPLTEERRKDLIKVVRAEAEGARVAIRNIRRDAISDIKQWRKEKEITEDEERKGGEEVQKITDRHVADVDAALAAKEKDLMEI